MNESSETKFKAGYIAIIGEPNVGKSTLMNALIGQKISIVTKKPQTTRQRILGIYSTDKMQCIVLDTPGLIEPKYLLHHKMIKSSIIAMDEADIILALIDNSQDQQMPELLSQQLSKYVGKKKIILTVNKIDIPAHFKSDRKIQGNFQSGIFDTIVKISALKKQNIKELEDIIYKFLPEHNPYYPGDLVSEHTERFFVAEFIREKIFENYYEEIPYSTAVEIREFIEREEGKFYINADILVERNSQKGMLIGKEGSALKKIGKSARLEIESFLQKPIYLDLHVIVKEKWRENDTILNRLGYGL